MKRVSRSGRTLRPGASRARAPKNPSSRQLVVLLHAHLPDCRRPDLTPSLEETWFFEALTESYLPFVRTVDRLVADGISPRVTLCVSPTLLGLLADTALRERYRARLRATEELARRDAAQADGARRKAAAGHARFLRDTRACFDNRCAGDLLGVWRELHAAGHLELATTAATHAFLPAHQSQPETIRTQIAVGLDTFAEVFGFRPTFFWLPECGFFPGLDAMLAEFGVRAFAVETHAITQAMPPSRAGVRAPVRCPSGLFALGRDADLSRVVWNAAEGYPGHPEYREFHRDGIHDLPKDLVTGWIAPDESCLPAGLKYWRVTGGDRPKAWYDPRAAAARARQHATDFVARLTAAPGDGICFVPFDAELFGHWWFEGPEWLEHVLRQLAEQKAVGVLTATAAATAHPAPHDARPAPSSWGQAGDHSYWINPDTAWIYPQLFGARRRLQAILVAHRERAEPVTPLAARAARQAARTLLLAQASDWPFLIRAGTAADLATTHVGALLERFKTLCAGLESGAIDAAHLGACESLDSAFPNLDLARFE